jgi:hypothetical protein
LHGVAANDIAVMFVQCQLSENSNAAGGMNTGMSGAASARKHEKSEKDKRRIGANLRGNT